jgi:hypothetical protein
MSSMSCLQLDKFHHEIGILVSLTMKTSEFRFDSLEYPRVRYIKATTSCLRGSVLEVQLARRCSKSPMEADKTVCAIVLALS